MELKLLIAGLVLFVLSIVMKKMQPRIQKPRVRRIYDEVFEWIETGWSAVILAAFLMYFFIQAYKIPSGSMRNTLLEGDHLFVNKFVYGFHIPLTEGKRIWPLRQVKRGDIIVFQCPPAALSMAEQEENVTKDFIKRCVAVSGDMVEIKDKKLLVNGKSVEEPYVNYADPTVNPPQQVFGSQEEYQRAWESGRFVSMPAEIIRDNFGPVIIPPGHYLAIGDNRDRSFDSRFWGPLPDHYLKGRALLLYWPPKRIRGIK